MTFIVATNVIASRLPERRLTGMPHAHAKRDIFGTGWRVTGAGQDIHTPVCFFMVEVCHYFTWDLEVIQATKDGIFSLHLRS